MKTKSKRPNQVMTTSMVGGERKYRIKKDALSRIEDDKKTIYDSTRQENSSKGSFTQFEKHMIQECIKQVLFAQGSEEVEVRYPVEVGVEGNKETVYNTTFQKIVPKEVIQFLLDYDMIEEYKYDKVD